MQAKNMKSLGELKSDRDKEDNIFAYIGVIFKHRKMIGYIVGVTFVLSFMLSFIMPNIYEATARVLPPIENNNGIAALLSMNNELLNSVGGHLIGGQTTASQYVGIMRSRTVTEILDKKFDLRKRYDLDYLEDVAEKLDKRTSIVVSKKNKIIRISVRDRDPSTAADMANEYVAALDRINRKLSSTQGRRKRIFLEERLKEVRNNLEQSELTLKSFQEKYNIVAIDEQAKTAIEGAARIKGEIISAKTELEVFKQFGTEKQVEALMLKAEIEELENQLMIIEGGSSPSKNNSSSKNINLGSNYHIPFDMLPNIGMQLIRLTREMKIQEKLFELLTAQYEMAQIEEAKDVDTIQILDNAIPPERKHSPKISLIILSSTIVSVLIAVLLSFILEYYYASKYTEDTISGN